MHRRMMAAAPLLLASALAMPAPAAAATVTVQLRGTTNEDKTGNAAEPGAAFAAWLSFDAGLLSGIGAYRQGGNTMLYTDQEYPDAAVALQFEHAGGLLGDETDPDLGLLPRPDLRFIDYDSASLGVTFFYEHLSGSDAGWFRANFRNIDVLTDPAQLQLPTVDVGYVHWMRGGTATYYHFTAQAVAFTVDTPLPAAAPLLPAGIAALRLGGSGGVGRRLLRGKVATVQQ